MFMTTLRTARQATPAMTLDRVSALSDPRLLSWRNSATTGSGLYAAIWAYQPRDPATQNELRASRGQFLNFGVQLLSFGVQLLSFGVQLLSFGVQLFEDPVDFIYSCHWHVHYVEPPHFHKRPHWAIFWEVLQSFCPLAGEGLTIDDHTC